MTRTRVSASLAVLGLALTMGAPAAIADDVAAISARPELTGTWTNASRTGLTRPQGVTTLVVGEEEAREIAASLSIAGISAEDPEFGATFSDPEKGAPEAGAADFGLKGYDGFWVAPGEGLAKVKGEYRTSYIVDPPSGQVPYTAAAQESLRARQASGYRYLTGIGGNTGPEDTPVAERCLIGFGQTGGPGMLSVLYNNTHEIVQTPNHVAIVVEMNHDVRVVPTFATPEEARANYKPSVIKKWLGDSVGWYADGKLYVETRNVHPLQHDIGAFAMSDDTVVTETFERHGDDEIFYTFTVNDPVLFSQPWKAELSFYPAEGKQYEYACHEGNYSMPGMLYGARLAEWEAEAEAKKKAGGKKR